MMPDYHVHTVLCKHAEGNAKEYLNEAEKRGIREICFTDHAPNPHGYDPVHRMEMMQFGSYKEMITGLQGTRTARVLFGVEADFYQGCESFLATWLPEQDFDLVLGSVHYIDGWGFDNPVHCHVWESVDVGYSWRRYFELVQKLAESGLYDAAAHLDLPKKFGYRPSERDLREMIGPVLDCIAEAGMGIELNTAGLGAPAREIYPSPLILSMAKNREIPICFGSDAHKPNQVGAGFESALEMALEAGYTHYFTIRRREKTLHPLPRHL